MTSTRRHAVVLGASMAGLLAARVLSDHYDEVTVVERDDLTAPGDRRGVPQGKHVHALLPRGEQILEDFFPGLTSELRATGAIDCHALAEVRLRFDGHTLRQSDAGYRVMQSSRPFLEWAVRQRVRSLPNVTIRDRSSASGLLANQDNSTVVGATVDGEEVAADLVVCALGRGAPVGAWLEDLGYERPAEDGRAIDMMYASRKLRLPPGSVNGDKEIIVADRANSRGMAMFAIEDDLHIATMIGFGGNFPTRDPDEWMEFAATIAPPDVLAALTASDAHSDISTYRYKANVRRRYERLRRFPDGLLIIGDAVCSFSPVYGQGMTMAALQAVAMDECLRNRGESIPSHFFQLAARAIDDAWLLTVIADSGMPHVSSRSPLMRAAEPLVAAGSTAAEHDGAVAGQVARIAGLIDPPTHILRPDLVVRSAFATARSLLALTLHR